MNNKVIDDLFDKFDLGSPLNELSGALTKEIKKAMFEAYLMGSIDGRLDSDLFRDALEHFSKDIKVVDRN